MEDEEEILSDVNSNKPLLEGTKESEAGERMDNGAEMTGVEQCESGSNLVGEEPGIAEKEAAVGGGGGPGGEGVSEEEEGKRVAGEVEDGGVDNGDLSEAAVAGEDAAGELKYGAASEVELAEGGREATGEVEVGGEGAENGDSREEAPEGDMSVVEAFKEAKDVSDSDVSVHVIVSEGEKIVDEGEVGDQEKDADASAIGVTSAVVAEGDEVVAAEEEIPAGATAEVEVHESVVEDDGNSLLMQSSEKERDTVADVLNKAAVVSRDDKISEEGTMGIMPTADTKLEMETDAGEKVSMEKIGEGDHVSVSHNLGVLECETTAVIKVEKDESEGPVEEDSLADKAQLEKEKQLNMEALGEKDEVKGEGNAKDEVRNMTEENSPLDENKLEGEKGRDIDVTETTDGQTVDSLSPSVDKNGEHEKAEGKEVGTEGTRMDIETETEVEHMETANDGDNEEVEKESVDIRAEHMETANDGDNEEVEKESVDIRADGDTDTEVEDADIENDSEGEGIDELDGPKTPLDETDDPMVAEEETPAMDTEVETETDAADSGKSAGGKRKRGKNKASANSKVAAKANRVTEEDVCFICFDGGDLVLCDRRGCPKAYHPSCVNRDEAFFRSKGRWNCGWHLCSICEKNASYMCYTCTFSLCKGCTKDAVILCVRGNKGFCETCMKTVMLIENDGQGHQDNKVNFDDRSSWEYLFKDYYIDLKSRLSLSAAELAEAKNPRKGADTPAGKHSKGLAGDQERASPSKLESPEPPVDANDDNSNEDVEARKTKRRKVKKRAKSLGRDKNVSDGDSTTPGDTEWASQELLEFVMHMKNGDKSIVSQYDVQALLLEYIKRNNLRDPRQKSRIICDIRLQNLFGKPRVGHFEMLKLLESHFLAKDDSHTDDVQVGVVDTEVDKSEIDGNTDTLTKGARDKKRKPRKKGDRRGPQSNLDDYAAIDMHNIGLIYLRRKLMEDLLEDIDSFKDKVVGTFVRIRISGSVQKQDLYRLVQVVGISKAADPYKVGKRTTDITVEILNLNKTEIIAIDTISNQDFTEEECKRLRQSIKCGLLNRLTVGNVLEKATELQTTRVNDWLESEIMRLSHLRDRASEKGRRKELRECVEKLQLLKTPEERQRRLEEIPEIHSDPRMDPSYESEDDSDADGGKDFGAKFRGSGSRGRGQISPRSDLFSKDSWSSGGKYPSKNWDLDRNLSSKNILTKGGDNNVHVSEAVPDNSRNQGRDRGGLDSSSMEKFGSTLTQETVGWNSQDVLKSDLFGSVSSVASASTLSTRAVESPIKINESEKMWHYRDPSGKVQGPFSMVQLRKWSNTGYFPADLKIWRNTGKENEPTLLTDALAGKFPKESVASASTMPGINNVKVSREPPRESQDAEKPKVDKNIMLGNIVSHMASPMVQAAPSVEVPKISTERWSRSDLTNLPSPTPHIKHAGQTGEGIPLTSASSSSQSQATVLPEYLTRSSVPVSVMNPSRTLLSAENDSNKSGTVLGSVSNSDRGGFVVSANTSQNPQPAMASEPHAVQVPTHMTTAQDIVAPATQSVNNQNPAETLGWGSAPSQKIEANPSTPVPVQQQQQQQQPFAQWGAIPTTGQSHAGNFSGSGTSTMPQSDMWRPLQSSQPSMQLPSMPNMQWAVGVNENNPAPPAFRPENSNVGWGAMQQGNPNMGWVGAAAAAPPPPPLNPNMNWGANVQGHAPSGIAASGWNPGATVPGQVPANANPGWGTTPGNHSLQGMAHGGGVTQNWIPPAGAAASTVQTPVPGNGWVPPAGNPGSPSQGPMSGGANQGWVPPAGNQGNGGPEQNNPRGKFLVQRENGSHGRDPGYGTGRPWNRQQLFGNGGAGGGPRHMLKHRTPCPYNQSGQCRKGASCNYLHT